MDGVVAYAARDGDHLAVMVLNKARAGDGGRSLRLRFDDRADAVAGEAGDAGRDVLTVTLPDVAASRGGLELPVVAPAQSSQVLIFDLRAGAWRRVFYSIERARQALPPEEGEWRSWAAETGRSVAEHMTAPRGPVSKR